MQIIVNARPCDVAADMLVDVLDELGFAGTSVATALNGQFVAREARGDVALRPGDRLEVLAPMQGG